MVERGRGGGGAVRAILTSTFLRRLAVNIEKYSSEILVGEGTGEIG